MTPDDKRAVIEQISKRLIARMVGEPDNADGVWADVSQWSRNVAMADVERILGAAGYWKLLAHAEDVCEAYPVGAEYDPLGSLARVVNEIKGGAK